MPNTTHTLPPLINFATFMRVYREYYRKDARHELNDWDHDLLTQAEIAFRYSAAESFNDALGKVWRSESLAHQLDMPMQVGLRAVRAALRLGYCPSAALSVLREALAAFEVEAKHDRCGLALEGRDLLRAGIRYLSDPRRLPN